VDQLELSGLKIQIMKHRKYLIIFLGIVATIFLIIFFATLLVKSQVGKTIQTTWNESNGDYNVTIGKVRILLFSPGMTLEKIKISTKKTNARIPGINGEISSVKLTGINLAKALFNKEIRIRKVTVPESSFTGKIPFTNKTVIPIVLPLKVRLGTVLFNKISLTLENINNAASYSFKDGSLKLYNVNYKKQDTLSLDIVRQFDLEIKELASVSADSMYSYKINGITYRVSSNTLVIDDISVHPTYSDYGFTSRHEYQSSRIEAVLSNIHVYDFNGPGYLVSGNLISSFIEVGNMDMKVFRDKRKEFRHVNKPAFQDMIYNYPHQLKIDSISLINGNITYSEHAKEANEPGSISFNEINSKIYTVTNDPIYKTKIDSLKLKGEALLMGKGRMSILLKCRIFDSQNLFSLEGALSNLDAIELNPILEKSAYVYATSGKIDSMNFRFTANNTEATGKLTLLYHDLDITVKNKQTDDTTAFRERFISFIANIKVLDSNPNRGGELREGIIYSARDPERFLFHYSFKAIMSGIKSSLQRVRKNG